MLLPQNKKKGEVVAIPGGVVDRGAYGRDDPVNWEILDIPLRNVGPTGSRRRNPGRMAR